MKKLIFPLYGFLIGAVFSMFAAILFAVIAVMILLDTLLINDPFQWLVVAAYAGLYSVAFAFLPGGFGGAYLAHWLSGSDRTASEVTRHGLFVGAIAGLIASIACILLVFYFSVDWATLGFTILAASIASVTSLLAARWLAKKRNKFVQPLIETTTRPTDQSTT